MSTITISELRPAGFGLFQDDETFLNELGEREIGMVSGGYDPGGVLLLYFHTSAISQLKSVVSDIIDHMSLSYNPTTA